MTRIPQITLRRLIHCAKTGDPRGPALSALPYLEGALRIEQATYRRKTQTKTRQGEEAI